MICLVMIRFPHIGPLLHHVVPRYHHTIPYATGQDVLPKASRISKQVVPYQTCGGHRLSGGGGGGYSQKLVLS
jgi:hypothetical protein